MENQSQRRASREFQEALSRAAAAALPALPARLDRGNEDNEPRADPGADGKILAQLESGTYRKPCRTKALQMTSRRPAQESLQPGVALQITAAANRLAFRFGERSFSS